MENIHGNYRKIPSGQKPPLRPHLSFDEFHAETGYEWTIVLRLMLWNLI